MRNTLAPIWLPHWPAWRWAISRISLFFFLYDLRTQSSFATDRFYPLFSYLYPFISSIFYKIIEKSLRSHEFVTGIRRNTKKHKVINELSFVSRLPWIFRRLSSIVCLVNFIFVYLSPSAFSILSKYNKLVPLSLQEPKIQKYERNNTERKKHIYICGAGIK